MNNFIVVSLAFILLPLMQASCVKAQTIDFSIDEAVLEQLERIKNKKFSREDVCIKRLTEPAEIIVVGLLVKDAGCRFDGVFIDSRYFERGNVEATKKALAALGWEKADQKQRGKLAMLLVEKVLLAFSSRSNQTFAAVSTDSGETKVIVSLKFPPGVTSRHAPKTFFFDKDGRLLSASDY